MPRVDQPAGKSQRELSTFLRFVMAMQTVLLKDRSDLLLKINRRRRGLSRWATYDNGGVDQRERDLIRPIRRRADRRQFVNQCKHQNATEPRVKR